MLNKGVLMGRLTRDPELRHTQSGTAVCSFTLAMTVTARTRTARNRQTLSTALHGASRQSCFAVVQQGYDGNRCWPYPVPQVARPER